MQNFFSEYPQIQTTTRFEGIVTGVINGIKIEPLNGIKIGTNGKWYQNRY